MKKNGRNFSERKFLKNCSNLRKNKDNKDKEDESLDVPEFKSLKDNDDKVPESGSLKV